MLAMRLFRRSVVRGEVGAWGAARTGAGGRESGGAAGLELDAAGGREDGLEGGRENGRTGGLGCGLAITFTAGLVGSVRRFFSAMGLESGMENCYI